MRLSSLGRTFTSAEQVVIGRVLSTWPTLGIIPAQTVLDIGQAGANIFTPNGWPVDPVGNYVPPNVRYAVMAKISTMTTSYVGNRAFFVGGQYGLWCDLKRALLASDYLDENFLSNLPYSLNLPPDIEGKQIPLDSMVKQYLVSKRVYIPASWVWRYEIYPWSSEIGAWYLGPSDADVANYDHMYNDLAANGNVQLCNLNIGTPPIREQFSYRDPKGIVYDWRYGLVTSIGNVQKPVVPDNSIQDIVTFISLAFGMYAAVAGAASLVGNVSANEAVAGAAVDSGEIYAGPGAQQITSADLTSAGSYSDVVVTPLDSSVSYTAPDFSYDSSVPNITSSPTGDVSNPLGTTSNPLGNSASMDGSEIYQGTGAQPITSGELTSAGVPEVSTAGAGVTASAGAAGSTITNSLVTKLGAGLLTALIPKNSPPVKPAGTNVVPLNSHTSNNSLLDQNNLLWVAIGGILYALLNKDKRDDK